MNAEFSWQQPKSPTSSEILEVLPSPATFRSLYERIDVLTARLHGEAGGIRSDAPSEQLAELAEAYQHAGEFENVAYVLEAAERLGYSGRRHYPRALAGLPGRLPVPSRGPVGA